MRRMIFLVAAAASFGLTPYASKWGVVTGSLALLALSMLLAMAASSLAGAIPAAAGALGALGSAMLVAVSPAAAGAVLVGLAYAERTLRIREQHTRLLHVGAAVFSGALAGSLANAFAAASPAVRAVSLVVAAVLVSLPLLLDADDPVAHALDSLAEDTGEPVCSALREGAELRRTVDAAALDRRTAGQVEATWKSLLRLAEARARIERSHAARVAKNARSNPGAASAQAQGVLKKLDMRITDHVAALTRAYTAVDTAKAAEISLDDAALRSAETIGESFEEVSKVIADEARV